MKLVKFNDEYYLLNDKDLEIGQEYNDTVANWDGERWVVFKTDRLFYNFKEVIASTKEIEGLLKIRNLQLIDLWKDDSVDPMKLGEDYTRNIFGELDDFMDVAVGFQKGYEKCLEDNADKLQRLIDFVKSVRDEWENVSEGYQIRAENLIQNITKQDSSEWNVEVEMEEISERCSCHCHRDDNFVMHFMACCDNGFIKYKTGKIKVDPEGYINIISIK